MSERADEMSDEVFGLITKTIRIAVFNDEYSNIRSPLLAVDIIRALNEAGYKIESSGKDGFIAPLTQPTKYFQGQDELFRLLQLFGLNEQDTITTVHLVARALGK